MDAIVNPDYPMAARVRRRANKLLRRAAFNELGKGTSGRIYPVGKHLVRKVYKNDEQTQEGRILTECPSPHFVKVIGYTENELIMERLGPELGHWKSGIRKIHSPEGLRHFLDNIGGELERYGILHRDFNPGNILFDPETGLYKLGDFYDAHYFGEPGRRLPPIAKRYPRDDVQAIEVLTDEALALIARAKLKRPLQPHAT